MTLNPVSIALSWLAHGVGLEVPKMQTAGAAGCDLHAALDEDKVLQLLPGKRAIVPCGFAMSLPIGFEAQIRPRSGLAAKHGITVLNSPGTIDADYRGEICVILINLGDDTFEIRRGDRIAQMVIASVCQAQFDVTTSLDATVRGNSGFGSTGHAASE